MNPRCWCGREYPCLEHILVSIGGPPGPKYCSECGAPNEPSAPYCVNCRAALNY